MIKILTKRGAAHELNSEDNYFLYEEGDIVAGALFDGCSTGQRSHWASETFKILFEGYKHRYNHFFRDLKNQKYIEHCALYFLYTLLDKLERLANFLNLDSANFLSTIIFFVYNKEQKILYCKFLGDGNLFLKKKSDESFIEYTIDENNVPNYLAYLMNIEEEVQIKSISERKTFYEENIEEFIISTDGIDSFINQNPNYDYLNIENAKQYLIENPLFEDKASELGKKYNLLKNDHWVPMDDLTIIKYISDEL